MLSSAPKKIKPFNDAEFVKRAAGRGPKAFLWSYDDDKAWFYTRVGFTIYLRDLIENKKK